MTAAEASAAGTYAAADGRRRRGADNRRRIVSAFLALVRGGNVSPTAEEVAERAGVGLRTVFRHFDDMESLYREMAAEIEAMVEPILQRPFASPGWRARVDELVARRGEIYEAIRPFRIAADARRHSSPFLDGRQRRFAREQHDALRRILPRTLAADRETFAALALILSPEAWLRLREIQGLSPAAATRTLMRAVRTLLRDAGERAAGA